MAFIPIALMAAGQVYQGMAADAQGKSAQNMANYNAQLAMRNKAQIEARGKRESIQQAEVAASRRSTITNQFGINDANILAAQAKEDEIENLLIGYDTQVAAQQQESQAALDRMQGDIYRQKGRNKAMSSYIGAGSTLLQGFS